MSTDLSIGQTALRNGKPIKARTSFNPAPKPSEVVLTQKARSAARKERKEEQKALMPKKEKKGKVGDVVKAPTGEFHKAEGGAFRYDKGVTQECFDAAVKYVEAHGWNVKLEYDQISVTMTGDVSTMIKNWTGQYITGWMDCSLSK